MLVSKTMEVEWNSATKKHYESLGYEWTKKGQKFQISIEHLPLGSDKKVKFMCDYCLGRNQTEEKDKWKRYADFNKYRLLTGKDCCNNRECKIKKRKDAEELKKIAYESSLEGRFPQLAKEWDYEKNEKPPSKHASMSHKEVWWICPKNNDHRYTMKISDRSHLNANCPYCSGRRVNETNSLGNLFPSLVREWNQIRNGDMTPFNVSPSSNKKVWWICEKEHEWKTSINNRTGVNSTNCPYCSNRKVCIDNCLATVFPEIAEEWHPTKNGDFTPFDTTPVTRNHVWWLGKCGHEWKCSLLSRTGKQKTGCPICNESKGEKRIRKFLYMNKIKFKSQIEFLGLVGIGGGLLKFDFGIYNQDSSLNFLLEYDGEFHFKKIFKDDRYENLVEHDKRKNIYCENQKISLVRIPYWEMDNIEKILTKELKEKNILSGDEELYGEDGK